MRLSSVERENEGGEHHDEKNDAEPVVASARMAFPPLAFFVAVPIVLPSPAHLYSLCQCRVTAGSMTAIPAPIHANAPRRGEPPVVFGALSTWRLSTCKSGVPKHVGEAA